MRPMVVWTIGITLTLLQGCASSQSTEESQTTASKTVKPRRFHSAADTNMEILRQKVKADKKLLVASNMDLTDAEAKQFWPVYDSYQGELRRINQKLGCTIMEYAEALKNGPVPNDEAENLMVQALDVEEAEVQLKRSYAGNLENVLPTTKIARYLQIENKIRAIVKSELAQRIPLVY